MLGVTVVLVLISKEIVGAFTSIATVVAGVPGHVVLLKISLAVEFLTSLELQFLEGVPVSNGNNYRHSATSTLISSGGKPSLTKL